MAAEVTGSASYFNDFLAGLDVKKGPVELVDPWF
jgi:hypothetical protein